MTDLSCDMFVAVDWSLLWGVVVLTGVAILLLVAYFVIQW